MNGPVLAGPSLVSEMAFGQRTNLLIRPEVRYDQALTSQFKPFEQNTSHNQVTLAVDVVLEF